MTAKRDLKKHIRDRQQKTGESYTSARAHVLREQSEMRGDAGIVAVETRRVEAAILKVNQQSARIRVLDGAAAGAEITFRSRDIYYVVPGQIATLDVEKRWTWLGDPYASGSIEHAHVDVWKLGLKPLPLEGGEMRDLRGDSEAFRRPDPYAPIWRKLTAKPRPAYEMDRLCFGELPGLDDNPTLDASELMRRGNYGAARALLMDTLHRDLRCLDAHAHLGVMRFEHELMQALLHYEVGVKIGELSLPFKFNGLLPWGVLWNRPFLRCLHGYGLCLWRLGRAAEARAVFERMLSLNPNDNQGVRYCFDDVVHGRSWQEGAERDERAEAGW